MEYFGDENIVALVVDVVVGKDEGCETDYYRYSVDMNNIVAFDSIEHVPDAHVMMMAVKNFLMASAGTESGALVVYVGAAAADVLDIYFAQSVAHTSVVRQNAGTGLLHRAIAAVVLLSYDLPGETRWC